MTKHRRFSDKDLTRIAKKYKFRGEFQKMDASAYVTARSRVVVVTEAGKKVEKPLIDVICAHMPKRKPSTDHTNRWTLEDLKLKSASFRTRGEFAKQARPEYAAARRYGILDEVCSHMQPAHLVKGKK